MAQETRETGASIPAWIGRLGLGATYVAAVLLLAVLVANLYLLLPDHAAARWLALLVNAAPPLALALTTLASYITYYGTWRILRHKDEYDAGSDLKSHAADIPAALQGLPARLSAGCGSLLAVGLFATALVATGLTLAPAPFQLLGVATSGAASNGPSHTSPGGGTGSQHTAAATPTATIAPKATATPVVVKFALSPSAATWDCNVAGRLVAPANVVLDNTSSNVAVPWTLALRETLGNNAPWATASQSQGSIGAGQRASVVITPSSGVCAAASPSGTGYHADITLGGAGTGTYSFTYTIAGLKRVAFKLSPTQYPDAGPYDCGRGNPPTVTLALDNSGSNVAVGYRVTMREMAPASNQPWATTDQTQGSVPAGQTVKLTLAPNPSICPSYSGATYHADVTLTSGGNGTYTFAYSVLTPLR